MNKDTEIEEIFKRHNVSYEKIKGELFKDGENKYMIDYATMTDECGIELELLKEKYNV